MSVFGGLVTVFLTDEQVTGMHFLSSVLLMRMNLPVEYRRVITRVLGDIEFTFYHRHFDLIFVLASTATIVFLLISRYTRASESYRR